MTGIIVKGIGGFYYVKSSGGDLCECRAKGAFRKEKIKPMIGDFVTVENGSLVEIRERKNMLVRPPVANIDNLVIVTAAASPSPDFFLIDKMTVTAQKKGINVIICVNKTDLASDLEIKRTYEKTGYPVISVCAEKNIGIENLTPYLKDKTTAFAGLSGVGKSSILTIITGKNLQAGDISEKIHRGKHTTRHVELAELSAGGFVLDTPGFSLFEVDGIKADELWEYFPEFNASGCRFKGCSHINEPGCVIKHKLEQNEIAKSRYESYCTLYEQLKQIKEWEK